MRYYVCRIFSVLSIVFFLPNSVLAISLTTSFKAPLTPPYLECNSDTSTTDCTTGSMELQSLWRFSAGTIEIDDNEVSLRLDGIYLDPSTTCTAEYGSKAPCSCWDTASQQQSPCDTDANCSGGDRCGPTSWNDTDNDYFTAHIFLQDKYDYFSTEKIRRDTNCHQVVDFDVKNTSGNKNRQVNQSITVNIEACGVNSDALGVEIREVYIEDKYGDIVAKMTH